MNVDRKSITTKLISLLEEVNYFIMVMRHESRLQIFFSRLKWIGYLLYDCVQYFIWIMYLIGAIINILLLFFYKENYPRGDPYNRIITVMGSIDLYLSIYVVFIFTIRNMPVIFGDSKDQIREELFNQPWRFKHSLKLAYRIISRLGTNELVYFSFYILSNIVGLVHDQLAFIFQLTFVVKIDLLLFVASAVWIRKTQLFLTFLLLLLIFYYYSLVGFEFFPEMYPHLRCTKLYECLMITFDLTFKDGGGIGVFLMDVWKVYSNYSEGIFYTRFFFDLTLAMILVNIMLNIVTGIIIDEFGSLKDSMSEKLDDIDNNCFVCGIDRQTFERCNVDFDVHCRLNHYKWNYIFFIAYLRTKKATDLTGTESFVNESIENKSIEFFPIKK